MNIDDPYTLFQASSYANNERNRYLNTSLFQFGLVTEDI
jgi:hypothetical protein